MERTLSIIKPNAILDSNIGNIIARFEKENLKIAAAKLVHLSKEKAEGFYIEHKDRPFFGELVTFMTSAPVMIMVLEGENAVHGSDSTNSAEREINYFFDGNEVFNRWS